MRTFPLYITATVGAQQEHRKEFYTKKTKHKALRDTYLLELLDLIPFSWFGFSRTDLMITKLALTRSETNKHLKTDHICIYFKQQYAVILV